MLTTNPILVTAIYRNLIESCLAVGLEKSSMITVLKEHKLTVLIKSAKQIML